MLPRHMILGSTLAMAMVWTAQAQTSPGDLNCDTVVDGRDVGPFVLALIDPAGYGAAYPGCSVSNADLDGDGNTDTDDVGGFVGFMLTGNCALCGACCLTGGSCSLSLQAYCTGTWQGAGSTCDPNPCPPPGMVQIGTGEFLMGNSFAGEGGPEELPRHAVYVNRYYMDIYEVTNQQYADALNWALAQGSQITVSGNVVYKYNTGGSYPYCDTTSSSSYSRITWNGTSFGVVTGKANHPMVQVSWYGSVAYANWRSAMQGKPPCYDLSTWECNFGNGYRLPTEAEWEKAARGGAAGHRFPWSDQDTIQHARCNYYSWSAYPYDTSPTSGYHPCWGSGPYPYTSPVDFSTGAFQYKVDWGWPGSPTSYQTASSGNGFGLFDMAGSVWEWCNDWYSGLYYSSSPYYNPHGPVSGTYRVMRGGGWDHAADHCRVAYRYMYDYPGSRINGVGFRCVAQ